MKNKHQKHFFHTSRIKHLCAVTLTLTITLSAFLQPVPTHAAQTDTAQTKEAGQDNTASQPETELSDNSSVITSIDPLSDEESTLFFDEKPSLKELTADLPASLSVHMDDNSDTILLPVTWECEEDYENTESDFYEFTPVWDTTAYPASKQLKSWDIPSIFVSFQQDMPDYLLTDAEEANHKLASLAKSKNLLALIYLCDSYEIKETPGADETTVLTVFTGQSVQIIGAGEDSRHNIWYRVKINKNDTDYEGYVERAYLAYSDEDFIAWEKDFITENPALASKPALMSTESAISEDINEFPASYQKAL